MSKCIKQDWTVVFVGHFGYLIPPPDQIPLHYFYFAWRKACRYQKMAFGFYDPVELQEFELNLEDEINSIHEEFATLSYETEPLRFYCFPKAPKVKDFLKKETKEHSILVDARPVTKIALRDQIAWATVVLVLGEWFDTNNVIHKEAEFRSEEQKKVYPWMVEWSCNNRLRRRYYQDQDYGYKRRLLNLTNSDLYESYQWGLRGLRRLREKQFNKVRKFNSGTAYYGETDIKSFYPTLNMAVVKETLINRLTKLHEKDILIDNIDNDAEKWNAVEAWSNLLERLCSFTVDTDCIDIDPDFTSHKIGVDLDVLYNSLPIGLIASGFLANCVLTDHLDHKLNDYCTQEKNEGNPTYVTRYTDDIMIVSSQEETVFKALEKIDFWLSEAGLKLSGEKTKPIQPSFFKERVNEKVGELGLELTPDQIDGLYQIHVKCPKIGPNDRVPGSTSIVDKLSEIGDQNLRALTNDELRGFLDEVFQLIDTKFAPEEIKDDTKASFASWRLKKGAKELKNRKLLESSDNELLKIIDRLKGAFRRYPYKLLLLDSYIIFLMENYNEQIKREFKDLFTLLYLSDVEDKDPHSNGRFLRTRMLFTIATNWSSLQIDNRQDVKNIIYTEVTNWYYSVSPCWHEQIAIYWLFTVADIKRDPNLANVKDPVIERVYILWKLSKQDIVVEIDPVLVMTMSSVLKRRRVWGSPPQLLPDGEIDWIKWVWSNLEKRKLSSLDAPRMWLELAYGRETIVPQYGYMEILNMCEKIDEPDLEMFLMHSENKDENEYTESYVIPIFSGAIEIVDRMIVYWLAKPGEIFVTDFVNAVKEFSVESRIREYIAERMCNLALIRMWVCQEVDGISMPDFVSNHYWGNLVDPEGLKNLNNMAKRNVPLKDWLDAIEACQQLEQTPQVMFPLNEMEITELILAIITKLQKAIQENIFIPNTMNIFLNREQWFNWRKYRKWCAKERNYKLPEINIETVHYLYEEEYCSPWLYFRDMQLDVENVCYSLANLMLRLMARRRHSKKQGVNRLSGWVNIGEIITRAASPSSVLAEIIAGTLNYQRPLYEYLSKQWNLGLSLLPLESLPIKDLDEFRYIMEKYLNENCPNFKYGLEIKTVDLDTISRWQND